jgi:hypothetical protein
VFPPKRPAFKTRMETKSPDAKQEVVMKENMGCEKQIRVLEYPERTAHYYKEGKWSQSIAQGR